MVSASTPSYILGDVNPPSGAAYYRLEMELAVR
jgi:hypothetical protein